MQLKKFKQTSKIIISTLILIILLISFYKYITTDFHLNTFFFLVCFSITLFILFYIEIIFPKLSPLRFLFKFLNEYYTKFNAFSDTIYLKSKILCDNIRNKIEDELSIRFFFILLDSIIFLYITFKIIEIILFTEEHIYPSYYPIIFFIISILFFNLSDFFLPPQKKSNIKFYFSIFLYFIATCIAPSFLLNLPVRKGFHFFALPIEWHFLPQSIYLILKSHPIYSSIFFIIIFACMLLPQLKHRTISKHLPFSLLLLLVMISIYYINFGYNKLDESFKIYTFLTFPMIFSILTGILNKQKLYTRTLLASSILILIVLFYFGAIPITPIKKVINQEGIELIYPYSVEKPADFPIIFIRDFIVDTKQNKIYTSYGPTCGIVEINLKTKRANVIDTKGLIRHLWTNDNANEIYAVDFTSADFIKLSKTPFAIKDKIDLYNEKFISPVTLDISDDKLFIITMEHPGITSFNLNNMKKIKSIFFNEVGITKFRFGPFWGGYNKKDDKIYVDLGPTKSPKSFEVAEINSQNLQVERITSIPQRGREFCFIDKYNSLLISSGYTDELFEIDRKKFKLKRVIKAPASSQCLCFDAKRNLIFAAGLVSGKLWVIDYKSGEKIKEYWVGKKPISDYLCEKTDSLYIGSGSGIFKLDLKKLKPNRIK